MNNDHVQELLKLNADIAVLRSRSENQQKEMDEIKKDMTANYVTYTEFNLFKSNVLHELDEGERLLNKLVNGQRRIRELLSKEENKEQGKQDLLKAQEAAKQQSRKNTIRWFVIASSAATCAGVILEAFVNHWINL